jgi:hypothetical protein
MHSARVMILCCMNSLPSQRAISKLEIRNSKQFQMIKNEKHKRVCLSRAKAAKFEEARIFFACLASWRDKFCVESKIINYSRTGWVMEMEIVTQPCSAGRCVNALLISLLAMSCQVRCRRSEFRVNAKLQFVAEGVWQARCQVVRCVGSSKTY